MSNIYAKVGESLQQIGGTMPEGFIEMQSPRPTEGQWVAKEDGTWELDMSAMRAQFSSYIQFYLDSFAQTRLYDNIMSACTYSTSTNPIFSEEGQYCVDARDNVWAVAYSIQDEVLAGTRPIPTEQELVALLPTLTWPTERPVGM